MHAWLEGAGAPAAQTARRCAAGDALPPVAPKPNMSPVPDPIRLSTEAGRAAVGLWLMTVALLAAPPLHQWLGVHRANRPEYALGSAVVLAALACVGLGVAVMAGLRALTQAIATAGVGNAASN